MAVKKASETQEFWKEYLSVPEISVDTAAISEEWMAATKAVLGILRKKKESPIEIMELSGEILDAIKVYKTHAREIDELSKRLLKCNNEINALKKSKQPDVTGIEKEFNLLTRTKQRYEPKIHTLCGQFMNERNAKKCAEKRRDDARLGLDEYRQKIFKEYGEGINKYLCKFNANFQIKEISHVNHRSGSLCNYYIEINGEKVKIESESGPSFRNTLSSGDRSALALAFFFLSVLKDKNSSKKIVVIDDAMTSLDGHRRRSTVQEIKKLHGIVDQVVILSHDKEFLRLFWRSKECKDNRAAMQILRAGDSSGISEWEIEEDMAKEHLKKYKIVRGYIKIQEPGKEHEVGSCLRCILENFIEISYPMDYPAEEPLGHFLKRCRDHAQNGCEPILSCEETHELAELLDYANKFHHKSESGGSHDHLPINDQELAKFCSRTLKFCSRSQLS